MTSSIFKHQEKFLQDKPLLSYCDVFDNHGLTPNELKNKDITIIFSESKVYVDGEVIEEYICKLRSGVCLYLSKNSGGNTYKLRAYYTQELRKELDFLINNIKRQVKNGTDNIGTDKTEDRK
jgi:hypothetical protein